MLFYIFNWETHYLKLMGVMLREKITVFVFRSELNRFIKSLNLAIQVYLKPRESMAGSSLAKKYGSFSTVDIYPCWFLNIYGPTAIATFKY